MPTRRLSPRAVCWKYDPVSVGKRYGQLVVVSPANHLYWTCRCDCGRKSEVSGAHLRGGTISACGCQRHKPAHNRAHNMQRSAEYSVWIGMRDRCKNPNNPGYHKYGGRGISVCAEWDSSFENFYQDMGHRPSSKHSLDRRDNDGPYAPWNCRWALPEQQQRNTRKNVFYEHAGRKLTAIEWSEISGVPYKTLHVRLRSGWPMERALNPAHGNSTRRS